MAMCLRYDILRSMNKRRVDDLADEGKTDEVLDKLRKQSVTASTPYFYGCVIGYILAIVTTVVIMLVFDHG